MMLTKCFSKSWSYRNQTYLYIHDFINLRQMLQWSPMSISLISRAISTQLVTTAYHSRFHDPQKITTNLRALVNVLNKDPTKYAKNFVNFNNWVSTSREFIPKSVVYEMTHLRQARRSTLAVFQALEAARKIQEALPYSWAVIAAKVLPRKAQNLRHKVGEATVVRLCLRALLSLERGIR